MSLKPETIAAINEFVTSRGLPFTDREILLGIAECAAASQNQTLTLQIPSDWPMDYQVQFWRAYPNRKDKHDAMKAIDKVAFSGKVRWADLINGIERYKLSRDVQRGFVKMPATFLNKGSWKDEEQTTPQRVERPSFFDVAAGKAW